MRYHSVLLSAFLSNLIGFLSGLNLHSGLGGGGGDCLAPAAPTPRRLAGDSGGTIFVTFCLHCPSFTCYFCVPPPSPKPLLGIKEIS